MYVLLCCCLCDCLLQFGDVWGILRGSSCVVGQVEGSQPRRGRQAGSFCSVAQVQLALLPSCSILGCWLPGLQERMAGR